MNNTETSKPKNAPPAGNVAPDMLVHDKQAEEYLKEIRRIERELDMQ